LLILLINLPSYNYALVPFSLCFASINAVVGTNAVVTAIRLADSKVVSGADIAVVQAKAKKISSNK
jgi:hypothetical protein